LYAARHEALLSDGWSVWQVKAHALRTDGFEAVYRDNTLHRRLNGWDYPLAWPALHAIVGYLLGRPTWDAASLTGVFCFLAIGWLLWASLRDRVPAVIAACAGLAAVAAWGIGSYAAAGFADMLIGLTLLGMIVEVERYAKGDPAAISRLAVYVLCASLTKNEGVFFGSWRPLPSS